MKTKTFLFLFVSMVFLHISCAQKKSSNPKPLKQKPAQLMDPKGTSIETRFLPPEGYMRTSEEANSFGTFLRKLPLKTKGSKVMYYDGSFKQNRQIYTGVVDLAIGKRDLHQCADAIMRLRADYLWSQERFDEIHFNFTNGFRVDYSKWMQGKRVQVKGNKCKWITGGTPSNSYKSYWKYMELIFSYAGTLSLEKELKPVKLAQMQIGDVFIQGGSPGHAVIVVDMCENTETKERFFMLAQSYMPAQEIQVLINPHSENKSPWYNLNFGEILETPEWNFSKNDLKRF